MMHFNYLLQLLVFIALLQGLSGFSFLKGPPKVNGIHKLPKNHGLKLPSVGGGAGGNGNPPRNNDHFTVIAQGGEENSSIVKLLKGWFQAYNHCLLTHPYLTKIISSAVVGGLGDILIQFWIPYSKGLSPKFELRRFLVFTSVAGFYIAPVLHVWFNYLNYFPVPSNFNRVAKSLVMIFLDQTIGAVVVNGGFFYAFELAQRLVPPYTEGLSLPAIWQAGSESVRRNMWKTLVMNWYSWPIINFLNFLYVPVQFRLLVSNVAAVFWNMFLSNTANS